jgi:predicted RNA-binding protein associated with RNAse of E/G family
MPLPLFDPAYLEKLRRYLECGDLAFDFENASEADKGEILDFLESIMDLAELADATATRLIFKDTYMDAIEEAKSAK